MVKITTTPVHTVVMQFDELHSTSDYTKSCGCLSKCTLCSVTAIQPTTKDATSVENFNIEIRLVKQLIVYTIMLT